MDALHLEMSDKCSVMHYVHGEDGDWHASFEVKHGEDSRARNAGKDILAFIEVIASLSPAAKAEFEACYLREFNVGFECWDSWSYVHRVPAEAVSAAADARCSIAVTLYPTREIDGTPKA
jgi:hypothetical protein